MLAFLAAMTFVLYLDRSCISQAAPAIQKELLISETQKAIIFNAFAPGVRTLRDSGRSVG